MKYLLIFVLFVGFLMISKHTDAQSLSFAIKTSPNISFDFNTIQKYSTGITFMNACQLNVVAVGTEWDLYVGATTTLAGYWDVTSTYSSTGNLPTVDMVKVRLRNTSNTPSILTYFDLKDIMAPTYLIGTLLADPTINCPASETNTAGSYLTSPGCYKFIVDLKIIPGLTFKAGLYSLRIDYIIIEDL
jgi:hypothetical protein